MLTYFYLGFYFYIDIFIPFAGLDFYKPKEGLICFYKNYKELSFDNILLCSGEITWTNEDLFWWNFEFTTPVLYLTFYLDLEYPVLVWTLE